MQKSCIRQKDELLSDVIKIYDLLFEMIEILPKGFIRLFTNTLSSNSDLDMMLTFLNSYLNSVDIKIPAKLYAALECTNLNLKNIQILNNVQKPHKHHLYEDVSNTNIVMYSLAESLPMVENIWGSIVRTLDLETKKIIRREIYVIETAHERRWQLMTKLYEALNEIQKENLYVYVTSNLNNKNPLYTGLIRDDKKLYGGKKKYIFNICKTLTENDLIGNQYIKITPFYKTKISNYMSYYDNILPNYIVTKEPFTKKLQKNFFVSDGAWLWTTADLFILNKHNILPKCGFFSYLYRRKNFRRVSIEENLALKKLLKKTFVFN